MADSNRNEEERRQLRSALKKQLANIEELDKQAEAEKQEQEELNRKIQAMESKVTKRCATRSMVCVYFSQRCVHCAVAGGTQDRQNTRS